MRTVNTSNFEVVRLNPIQRQEIKNKCSHIKPFFKNHQINTACRVIQEMSATQTNHLKINSSTAAARWNKINESSLAVDLSVAVTSLIAGILSTNSVSVSSAVSLGAVAVSRYLNQYPEVQVGFKVTYHTTFLYRWSPFHGQSGAFWGGGVTIINEMGQLVHVGDFKTVKDPDLSQDEAQAILQASQSHQEKTEVWN
jgi:hypothetical protein